MRTRTEGDGVREKLKEIAKEKALLVKVANQTKWKEITRNRGTRRFCWSRLILRGE